MKSLALISRPRGLSCTVRAASEHLASRRPHGQGVVPSAPSRALSSTVLSSRPPEQRLRYAARSTGRGAASRGLRPLFTDVLGSARESYVAYGLTKTLFVACSKQADYTISEALRKAERIPKTAAGEDIGSGSGWWYEEIGLLPTFSAWAQVTFLHMHLINVRLRALRTSEASLMYHRLLLDHFSHEAELRMDEMHGLTSRAVRVTYLKDLFIQWRGIQAAYDEGLAKGDPELAAAVWRNLFKGQATDHRGNELDWSKIARVVLYIRRNLDALSQASPEDVLLAFRTNAPPAPFFTTVQDEEADYLSERPKDGSSVLGKPR